MSEDTKRMVHDIYYAVTAAPAGSRQRHDDVSALMAKLAAKLAEIEIGAPDMGAGADDSAPERNGNDEPGVAPQRERADAAQVALLADSASYSRADLEARGFPSLQLAADVECSVAGCGAAALVRCGCCDETGTVYCARHDFQAHYRRAPSFSRVMRSSDGSVVPLAPGFFWAGAGVVLQSGGQATSVSVDSSEEGVLLDALISARGVLASLRALPEGRLGSGALAAASELVEALEQDVFGVDGAVAGGGGGGGGSDSATEAVSPRKWSSLHSIRGGAAPLCAVAAGVAMPLPLPEALAASCPVCGTFGLFERAGWERHGSGDRADGGPWVPIGRVKLWRCKATRGGKVCGTPVLPGASRCTLLMAVKPLTQKQPRAYIATSLLAAHRRANLHTKGGIPAETFARQQAAAGAPVRLESLRGLLALHAVTFECAYSTLCESNGCLTCGPNGLILGAATDGNSKMNRRDVPGAPLAGDLPGSVVIPAGSVAAAVAAFDQAGGVAAQSAHVSAGAAATRLVGGSRSSASAAPVAGGVSCSFAADREESVRVKGLDVVVTMAVTCRHLVVRLLAPARSCERLVHQFMCLVFVAAAAAGAGETVAHSTHDTTCMLLRYVHARAEGDPGFAEEFLHTLNESLRNVGVNVHVEWGDIATPATLNVLFVRLGAEVVAPMAPMTWRHFFQPMAGLSPGSQCKVCVSLGVDGPHSYGHTCAAHFGNPAIRGTGSDGAVSEITWAALVGNRAATLRNCGPAAWELGWAARAAAYNSERMHAAPRYCLTQVVHKAEGLQRATAACSVAFDIARPVCLAGAAEELHAVDAALFEVPNGHMPRTLAWLEGVNDETLHATLDAHEQRLRRLAVDRVRVGARVRTLRNSSALLSWFTASAEVSAVRVLLDAAYVPLEAVCPQCDAIFVIGLEQHVDAAHPQRSFICDYLACGEAFVDDARRQAHEDLMHPHGDGVPEPVRHVSAAFPSLLAAVLADKTPSGVAGSALRRYTQLRGRHGDTPQFVEAVHAKLVAKLPRMPPSQAGDARTLATELLADIADIAAEYRCARIDALARVGDEFTSAAASLRAGRLRDEVAVGVQALQRLWPAAALEAPLPLLEAALDEAGLDAQLYAAQITPTPPAIMAALRARHAARRSVEALAHAVEDVQRLADNAAARVARLEAACASAADGDAVGAAGRSGLFVSTPPMRPLFCSSDVAVLGGDARLVCAGLHSVLSEALARGRVVAARAARARAAVSDACLWDTVSVRVARDASGRPLAHRRITALLDGSPGASPAWWASCMSTRAVAAGSEAPAAEISEEDDGDDDEADEVARMEEAADALASIAGGGGGDLE